MLSLAPRAATATAPPEEVEAVAGGVPTAVTGHHLPALDGLRAVAVGGVIAYHLGPGWASGGYLGVDLFFVLSGFLITSLLVEERALTGRVRLAAFWARRARRLLPALFCLLAALALYVALMGRFGPAGWAGHVDLSGLRGDALATLLYVANWHAIFAHQSYFAQFAAPSPLRHTWSLAIEEQFYLVWPLVVVVVLAVAGVRRRRMAGVRRRRPGRWRWIGITVAMVGVAMSAGLMATLYRPGTDPTRAYFGTDTRMFDLLVGAVAAMLIAARPQPSRRARLALHWAAPVAAGGLGLAWAVAGTRGGVPEGWMFEGGFLGCALAAGVVVADTSQHRLGPLGQLLAWPPLRWVGTISYGLYLWHWPVLVYVDAQTTGLRGARLDLARLAIALCAATASYYLVERPLRRARFTGVARFAAAPAGAVLAAAAVVVATAPAVAVAPSPSPVSAEVEAMSAWVMPGGRVPGAGGLRHEAMTDVPSFGPAHPLRVMVVGDSVAKGAEPAIAAALGATGEVRVANATIDGFGLSTDPGWRASLPGLVSAHRAQIVLATWSWDDQCSPQSPTPFARRAGVCALEHPRRYERMLATAARLMLGRGASAVVFLQFPTASGTRRRPGEQAWGRAARQVATAMPGRVLYLPVAPSVLLGDRFSSWLPPAAAPSAPKADWVRVRMVDGVHLCPAGAARYADAVLADLTELLHLRPARAGWAGGRWSASGVYGTPPGACPADHPQA